MNCVVSSIPGRVRLRHAALRDSSRLARLGAVVEGWPGVLSVTMNARTGSLLATYDVDRLPERDCLARCQATFAGLAPEPVADSATAPDTGAPSPVARPARRSGAPRVRANRLAKQGMLASLAVSMLLAAIGAKRWHIWTGMFFLHALGVHLWVHHRNLLR